MNIIVSDGTGEESTVVEWNDNDISPCHVRLAVGGTLTTSAQCLRKLWECLEVLYASPRAPMNIIVSDGTGEESTVVEWNDNDISPCHIRLAVGGTLTTSAQCLRKLWECLEVLYASPRTQSGEIRSS